MRTEISRLQKRMGITTVYVTHDQTEAMTLGDRVAVLKRGILQQLATPRELYEQPVNLFVAGFIGSPPMNFMPATVEGDQVELPFATVGSARARPRRADPEDTLLIAGIRPEHFEDATVLDGDKADGATFRREDRRGGVARQRGLRLHPVRRAAGGAVPAGGARARSSTPRRCERSSSSPSTRPAASRTATRPSCTFDSRRMHLFEPGSGENLTLRKVSDDERAAVA